MYFQPGTITTEDAFYADFACENERWARIRGVRVLASDCTDRWSGTTLTPSIDVQVGIQTPRGGAILPVTAKLELASGEEYAQEPGSCWLRPNEVLRVYAIPSATAQRWKCYIELWVAQEEDFSGEDAPSPANYGECLAYRAGKTWGILEESTDVDTSGVRQVDTFTTGGT